MLELLHQGILIHQGILTAILSTNSDITQTLALLKEGQYIFSDPLCGMALHAEVVYSAIKQGKKEILKHLLNLPIISDINFFKFCGHTPLSLAIEEGKQDLIPLLLAKTDKNFALHMAVKLKQEKIKKLLLSNSVFKPKFLKFLGLT